MADFDKDEININDTEVELRMDISIRRAEIRLMSYGCDFKPDRSGNLPSNQAFRFSEQRKVYSSKKQNSSSSISGKLGTKLTLGRSNAAVGVSGQRNNTDEQSSESMLTEEREKQQVWQFGPSIIKLESPESGYLHGSVVADAPAWRITPNSENGWSAVIAEIRCRPSWISLENIDLLSSNFGPELEEEFLRVVKSDASDYDRFMRSLGIATLLKHLVSENLQPALTMNTRYLRQIHLY